MEAVLEDGGFEEIEVTEAGLREGVFFKSYLGGDPPLFDDVRRASVVNLAAQYRIDPAPTPRTSRALALGLFDELAAAGLHPGDAGERELLWAAAMLHDIGITVDYDDHHKHSRYLDPQRRAARLRRRARSRSSRQAVRYHRKGIALLGELASLAERATRSA